MAKLATATMQCVYDKRANVKKMLDMIDQAADNGADFIAFPELAAAGYLVDLHRIQTRDQDGFDEYWYQYENAERVPQGPTVQAVMRKAAQRNIYVSFGMARRDDQLDHKLFNSVVLVGPEGYIGRYDKVHLPIDEAHMFYHGTQFPVFDTQLGRIGFNICCDINFPEAAREVTLQGADILVYTVAWAFNEMEPDPDTDGSFRNYVHLLAARAIENQCFVLCTNQFGVNGTMNFFGHGDIIHPTGEAVASTGFAEGIAYYETESIRDDMYRGRYSYFGLNLLKERQPNYYTHQNDPRTCAHS